VRLKRETKKGEGRGGRREEGGKEGKERRENDSVSATNQTISRWTEKANEDVLRPHIVRSTETRTGDEGDVGVLSDRSVGGKNRLVDVLARMVTSGSTSSPLKNDGEVGVGGGDVDDLSNALDGSRLERDVLDAGRLEGGDDLDGLFRRRHTGGDAEAFDRKTLSPHLLPERELERELTLVDVERVEGDSDSGLDLGLDLGDLGSEGLGVVVTSPGELDVEASVENGRDEAGGDGAGRHSGDHDRGLSEESREWGVNVDLAVPDEKKMKPTEERPISYRLRAQEE
jgi:hypothetical protein